MLLYRFISIILFPFLELYIFLRVYKKKEDKNRLNERFGKSSQKRPEGDLLWIHAVSVGEANSVLILIDELLKTFPQTTILFTTTTLTSAAIVGQKLPEFQGRVIHQFLPIDSYACAKSFLNFWQPSRVIFSESEIWPNLIFEANQSGAKVFLANARMSEKSAAKWYWAKKFGFKIFDYFDVIFAQSEDDQKRLQNLAKKEVLFYGNLKSQARDLTFDIDELVALRSQIGDRKFWVAASTHKGEEQIVIAAHQELKKDFPDLLTIIIPRHPNRAEEVKVLIGEINFAQRSQNQEISAATEIYLADSLGELGIFYRLKNFAFIGGSLVEVGGHNPFEAIKLGCGVISGSHVFNFAEIYEKLTTQQACIIVYSSADLVGVVKEFLDNPEIPKFLVTESLEVIKSSGSIATKIVSKIYEVCGVLENEKA